VATVLAGPILRKVTPASVTVWLAFREATTVTLTVWATDKPAAGTTPLMTGVAPATKIGPNLYIVAVTAVPTSANLAYGTIYFYKLTFATTSADALDLVAATKTTDMTAWAYMPYQLPSFLLPPTDLQQVRLSVGSCRKMHTQSLDALALLDDVITGASNDPVQRPQLLMMGGDQIYADDVTATLLVMLTDAGVALIGSEEVPIDSSSSLAPESAPPMTRSSRIKKAGFTSDDTKNHLMGLGEYLAMYLFAWSDAVWPAPTDVPTVDNVTAMPNVNDHFGDENVFDAIKELETMAVERTQIIAVLSTLPKVRRALANIATYMILDDHEITDDFNMQRKFCDAVYASALGMRVVQNGLTAYALCQHWGNCPEQFTGRRRRHAAVDVHGGEQLQRPRPRSARADDRRAARARQARPAIAVWRLSRRAIAHVQLHDRRQRVPADRHRHPDVADVSADQEQPHAARSAAGDAGHRADHADAGARQSPVDRAGHHEPAELPEHPPGRPRCPRLARPQVGQRGLLRLVFRPRRVPDHRLWLRSAGRPLGSCRERRYAEDVATRYFVAAIATRTLRRRREPIAI
jgi:hypothetical protein